MAAADGIVMLKENGDPEKPFMRIRTTVLIENGDPEKPVMRIRTTSPSFIANMVVNATCIVAGNRALGESYRTFAVSLNEPTAAVVVIGNGLTGPEAAFVSILNSEEFQRTPACGIKTTAE
jgi:hypothetical protein